MFKKFLIKKMLKKQGVPEEQQEMVLTMMEKDPDLFKKIAKEIEEKKKGGMNEMYASMAVMKKYQAQIQKLMQS